MYSFYYNPVSCLHYYKLYITNCLQSIYVMSTISCESSRIYILTPTVAYSLITLLKLVQFATVESEFVLQRVLYNRTMLDEFWRASIEILKLIKLIKLINWRATNDTKIISLAKINKRRVCIYVNIATLEKIACIVLSQLSFQNICYSIENTNHNSQI